MTILLPFQFWLLYLSFLPNCSGKVLQYYLEWNEKGGHSYPVSDLRRNAFNFYLLRMMLAVGLAYMTFLIYSILHTCIVESFYHNVMLNSIKYLLCIYWGNKSLSLHFVLCGISLWLCMLNYSYIPGKNPT